jgi:hypothetical protein
MIKLFEWVKNNFYLFGTTAFPGVHKIVLLFVVNAVFSLEITADFINDIFILYLLGYYTVFNWSNFILVDMMKLPKEKHQVFFGKILGDKTVNDVDAFKSWMFETLVDVLGKGQYFLKKIHVFFYRIQNEQDVAKAGPRQQPN